MINEMHPETLITLMEFTEIIIRLSQHIMQKDKQFVPSKHQSANTLDMFLKIIHEKHIEMKEDVEMQEVDSDHQWFMIQGY